MYVTYCSGRKLPTEKPLPPHQLYLSDRVWYVRQLAKDAHEDFAVLSGEFGLVGEEQCIPLYEHLLQPQEVEEMAKKVAQQLKDRGVRSVVFFFTSADWSRGGALQRYNAVLQYASKLAGIDYTTRPIEFRGHGEPTPVRPENIEIGGPHTMQKQAVYLLRAQDEKGLWKNVRETSFLPDLQIKARSLVKKYPNQKVEIIEKPNDGRLPF